MASTCCCWRRHTAGSPSVCRARWHGPRRPAMGLHSPMGPPALARRTRRTLAQICPRPTAAGPAWGNS
eukprot:8426614-Lingulodinium_polyedra.AAC.1